MDVAVGGAVGCDSVADTGPGSSPLAPGGPGLVRVEPDPPVRLAATRPRDQVRPLGHLVLKAPDVGVLGRQLDRLVARRHDADRLLRLAQRGLAWVDLSTGRFHAEDLPLDARWAELLLAIAPRECLFPEGRPIAEVAPLHWLEIQQPDCALTPYPEWHFDHETGRLESVQNPFEARVLPMSPV